ncbi:hypothetical protein PVAP13_7KG278055 [Panicum virgatum]|uniref:Uncharacterized protein n=1 Tax=Panicum virgatum TaxID=38727 RepID=A0A8T0QKE7_PANVG|nr:hypothetical protein PVAP13_7KG278055 [Panicum virgatum]
MSTKCHWSDSIDREVPVPVKTTAPIDVLVDHPRGQLQTRYRRSLSESYAPADRRRARRRRPERKWRDEIGWRGEGGAGGRGRSRCGNVEWNQRPRRGGSRSATRCMTTVTCENSTIGICCVRGRRGIGVTGLSEPALSDPAIPAAPKISRHQSSDHPSACSVPHAHLPCPRAPAGAGPAARGALAPLSGRRQGPRPGPHHRAWHRILGRRRRGEPARPINVTRRGAERAARRPRRARELCVIRRRDAGRCARSRWPCAGHVRRSPPPPPPPGSPLAGYVSRRGGGIRPSSRLRRARGERPGNIPAPAGREGAGN